MTYDKQQRKHLMFYYRITLLFININHANIFTGNTTGESSRDPGDA